MDKKLEQSVKLIMKAIRESNQDKKALLSTLKNSNISLKKKIAFQNYLKGRVL